MNEDICYSCKGKLGTETRKTKLEVIERIKVLNQKGLHKTDIARLTKVSRTTVYRVLNGYHS